MTYQPSNGDTAVHSEHGKGIVGDCSDYQYCYFTVPSGQVFFVCKDRLSKSKGV